jgi:hypothetical protein
MLLLAAMGRISPPYAHKLLPRQRACPEWSGAFLLGREAASGVGLIWPVRPNEIKARRGSLGAGWRPGWPQQGFLV